jgi:ADP-ribose pyrophosphatase YjhB (NUDIX family)
MKNPKSINQTILGEVDVFQTMVASGPVIIQKKDNELKTLLVKHGNKPISELKWKFCGGKLIKNYTLEDNAIREAKEEIGIKVTLVEPLPTLELWNEKPESGQYEPELIILVHYLAEIKDEPIQGKEIKDMQWFSIHNLPDDCQPNVYKIIDYYKDNLLK